MYCQSDVASTFCGVQAHRCMLGFSRNGASILLYTRWSDSVQTADDDTGFQRHFCKTSAVIICMTRQGGIGEHTRLSANNSV